MKFMHKFNNKKLPNSYNNYFRKVGQVRKRVTRASDRKDLVVTRCKKKVGEKSIKFVGAKLWNTLPSDLKESVFDKFKIDYKNLMFAHF